MHTDPVHLQTHVEMTGEKKVGEQNGEKLTDPFRTVTSKSLFCRLVVIRINAEPVTLRG